MKPVYIYALRDPENGDIFYVGKSTSPTTRYRGHFKSARSFSNKLLHLKVQKMRDSGSPPVLTILEVCGDDWRVRERSWIAFLRGASVALENITAGGLGATFGHFGPLRDSAERAVRIRREWWKWWNSLTPEQKSIENKKKMTESTKTKLSLARKGIPQSEAHKMAVIASKNTPEFHVKASLSQKRVWAEMSPEKRSKIIKQRRASSLEIWRDLDSEQRTKRLTGLIATKDSQSQRRRALSFWDSMSPDQRTAFCERKRQRQLESFRQRRLAG